MRFSRAALEDYKITHPREPKTELKAKAPRAIEAPTPSRRWAIGNAAPRVEDGQCSQQGCEFGSFCDRHVQKVATEPRLSTDQRAARHLILAAFIASGRVNVIPSTFSAYEAAIARNKEDEIALLSRPDTKDEIRARKIRKKLIQEEHRLDREFESARQMRASTRPATK
jgi:hypothetical protein